MATFISFSPYNQTAYAPGTVDGQSSSWAGGEAGGGFQAVLTNVASQVLQEADNGVYGDGQVNFQELQQQTARYEQTANFVRQYFNWFPAAGMNLLSLKRALELKLFSARFMLSYFDQFASAATGDNTRINPADVTALSRRDGNAFDISYRDVNNLQLTAAPTTPFDQLPRNLQFIQP